MAPFLKCTVAVALPLFFVSIFVGCLASCATHVKEESVKDLSHAQLLASELSDCCSLQDGQSLLPERVSLSIGSANAENRIYAFTRPQPKDSYLSSSLTPSSPSPPARLPGTLRI